MTGQRDTPDTVQWYRDHETTAELGYDPAGWCLKICRSARNIGPAYLSAVAAAAATPSTHRVYGVEDITRGMVVYYDDPNDSNPFGHIVTVVGRRKGADRSKLSSLLVRTNSVVAGRIVVVGGDYFGQHWGDAFQFGATWLNGVVLDLPDVPQQPKPPKPIYLGKVGTDRLRSMIDTYTLMIENQRRFGNRRIVNALKRDRQRVRDTLAELTDH